MLPEVSFDDTAATLAARAVVLDVWQQLVEQQRSLAARWNDFQDLRCTRDGLWKALRKDGQCRDLPVLPNPKCVYSFVTSARGVLQMVRALW